MIKRVSKKRGISAIVATVLIILITVAAVAIVWVAIIPMISDLSKIKSSDKAISIDTAGGYTLYDEEYKIACVQIKKESSENLEGLRVLFSVEGNSQSFAINKSSLPELGQKKTYCFSLEDLGKPDTVTVVTLPEKGGFAVTSVIPVSELTAQAVTSIIGGGEGTEESVGSGLIYSDNHSTYYYDYDGDNYGNSLNYSHFITGKQPLKFVSVGGDCNDSIGSVNPGASEVMNNGVDENCNGWASINNCAVLNRAGINYDLTQDLRGKGPCITITGSNINLDGKGHWIVADDSDYGGGFMQYGSGIYAYNVKNITVKNLNITSIAQGLYFERVNNSVVTGVSSKKNGYNGIWITDSSLNRIESNDFSENGYDGIWLHWNSNNNTIKNNIVKESGYGLYIENAIGNIFQGNNFCSYVGVRGGSTSQIDLGNIYATKEYGDWLGPSQGTCPELPIRVYGCSNLNQAGKVYKLMGGGSPYPYSSNCLVISANNIILDGNGQTISNDNKKLSTLVLATGRNNITIQNLIVDGGQENIYLNTVTNSTMRNITVKNAKFNGFKIWNSQNITFEGNTMTNNSWDAIWFYNSNNNTVKNNIMTNNSVGLWFESSQYNKISGNRICNNTLGLALDLECRPNGMGSPQTQIDLGSNTYRTQNQCTSWLQASTGSCN